MHNTTSTLTQIKLKMERLRQKDEGLNEKIQQRLAKIKENEDRETRLAKQYGEVFKSADSFYDHKKLGAKLKEKEETAASRIFK
jgi:hypothetical protein